MELQLEYVDIKQVEFTDSTACRIEAGTLYINRGQLVEKFADPSLAELDIVLAHPGENCRIVNVGDVIQPRVKVAAPDTTFPGILGKLSLAGDGVTKALRGVTVMEGLQISLPQEALVDMSGPAAAYTVFARTHNIVVTATPAAGVDNSVYLNALKKATLSISVFLAQLAIAIPADQTERFGLKEKQNRGILPRVIYVWVLFAHKNNCESLLYGSSCQELFPTIIHPNEVLDGAIVNRNYIQLCNGETTYMMQNHALIRELYARDGVDIDFAGVLLVNSSSDISDKKRSAMMAANLAHHFLQADLAVITKEGGGHPQLDMALCCESMSKFGIKSSLIIIELMATGASNQDSVIFNNESAAALVSGGRFEYISIPAVERVIGGDCLPETEAPTHEALLVPNRWIRGSLSQFGESSITSTITG